MSHPTQTKYGACKATNKHGAPCGLAVVRNGFCMFHQPEEMLARLKRKLDRNHKQRDVIVAELREASNGKYGA